ncbi:MAG: hypothetical protein WDZ49_16965 [Litorilinea sp.]
MHDSEATGSGGDADNDIRANNTPPDDAPAPMPSRRTFLGAIAGGMTALVVAACGRADPTPPAPTATGVATRAARATPPTPATSELFLPEVHQGELAALAQAQPTLTPTPPKPAATPTVGPPPPNPPPSPPPIPPGPPSKLGLHIGWNDSQIFTLLRTQGIPVVKTLELDANFVREIKETSPRTRIIGRIHLPQIDLSNLDPIPAARSFVERLLPIAEDEHRRPYFDAWEAYNEPVAGSDDEMRRLADFEAERTRLMAQAGLRSVIANFGTGQPELERWPLFLPAVQAAKENDGWLGLHEYSAPTIYYLTTRENQGRYPGVSPEDTGWLTLRYRMVYRQILEPANLVIPLVFTELGVDGLVDNRPGPADARGWQHFQSYWAENGYGLWGPGAYVEQLAWYDAAMRQDDYVIGGCIYCMAATRGWESYDIRGPVASVLEQYLSVHAPA